MIFHSKWLCLSFSKNIMLLFVKKYGKIDNFECYTYYIFSVYIVFHHCTIIGIVKMWK